MLFSPSIFSFHISHWKPEALDSPWSRDPSTLSCWHINDDWVKWYTESDDIDSITYGRLLCLQSHRRRHHGGRRPQRRARLRLRVHRGPPVFRHPKDVGAAKGMYFKTKVVPSWQKVNLRFIFSRRPTHTTSPSTTSSSTRTSTPTSGHSTSPCSTDTAPSSSGS